MIKITRLDWDSDFWDFNIYNSYKCCETSKYKLEFDKEMVSSPFIIQALVTDKDIEYINLLEDAGLNLWKVKLI